MIFKLLITFLNIRTLVFPIYTFSSAGTINKYTPCQGTDRENYFNYIKHKEKMLTLARIIHLSLQFFP